jgi:hypothetical protein
MEEDERQDKDKVGEENRRYSKENKGFEIYCF